MSGTIVAKIRYENSTYQTHGELPRIGTFAPDVSLVNTKLQNVSLANFAGLRKIMFVGVSIDTEVFARSVIRLDEYAAGREKLAVLVVTYDLPFAHSRFKKAHDLNFTLLADPKGEVAHKFGVPYKLGEESIEREIEGQLEVLTRTATIKRWTFVIDRDGRIAMKNDKVKAAEDSQAILEFVAELKQN